MHLGKAFGGVTLALLAVVPGTASACWSPRAAEAAQVRAFETMLMVSALRCQASHRGMLDDYNKFVRTSRASLIAVNDDLRAHFARRMGGRGSLNAYDGYVTSIANSYGAGVSGLNCADMQSIVREATAAGGVRSALADMAQRIGVVPSMPGGRCTATAAVIARP